MYTHRINNKSKDKEEIRGHLLELINSGVDDGHDMIIKYKSTMLNGIITWTLHITGQFEVDEYEEFDWMI